MNILTTERTALREIVADDAAFILNLLNQPSFIKYIGDRNVRTLDEAREFIEIRYRASYREHGFGLYAVERKTDKILLGMCGFVRREGLPAADIGFAFLPQFEKQGYAYESANAVMRYGRETLGLTRILAITSLDNESSGKLLAKLGFKFERNIRLLHSDEDVKLFSSDD